MEYRVGVGQDDFVLALRGGMAERRPAFGVGLDFSDVFAIDAAYSNDPFLGEPSYFGQISLGW
jgi:hypothetical protein